MTENEISKIILDVSFCLHTKFGPGLFESVYEDLMAYELEKNGLRVEKQKILPVVYENLRMESAFRIDLLVNNAVIVEIKSVESILPVHKKQLLTYLRLADKRLGLLINFNEAHLKDGITRIVNNLV
ncbi:MAG: GxxExxY protein [Candidatus Marinimicrobia bacterium CG08_land_8_20_14_0_20_45_22]|nr:MAG: GxxExxY protein [Candidatus Marinimicrobia bacterium CG08_land_8_20_14_0_20_45_22]